MRNKKILLTGVNGQVGHALMSELSGFDLVGLSRSELDISNPDAIRKIIHEIKPNVVINPAAYTAVDKAESEMDLAYAINATAAQVMAEETAKINGALIHFSTDYVYDGNKHSPYAETDVVNPSSVYGSSKLAGEDAIRAVGLPHLILRTSWVYGAHGKNFLKTILRLAVERNRLGIVADQIGAPTSSLSIASALKDILVKWSPEVSKDTGVYHLTNSGSTSWHGFACEIVSQYKAAHKSPSLKAEVNRIDELTTSDYPTPAARPKNSCLDNSKLTQVFGVSLPSWQLGLQEVMKTL